MQNKANGTYGANSADSTNGTKSYQLLSIKKNWYELVLIGLEITVNFYRMNDHSKFVKLFPFCNSACRKYFLIATR